MSWIDSIYIAVLSLLGFGVLSAFLLSFFLKKTEDLEPLYQDFRSSVLPPTRYRGFLLRFQLGTQGRFHWARIFIEREALMLFPFGRVELLEFKRENFSRISRNPLSSRKVELVFEFLSKDLEPIRFLCLEKKLRQSSDLLKWLEKQNGDPDRS